MRAVAGRRGSATTATGSRASSASTCDEDAGRTNPFLDEFVDADLDDSLPFADDSFDLVYANFVVEHLGIPTCFTEWRRVLGRRRLVLLTSNRANPLLAVATWLPQRARLALKRRGAGAEERDVYPTRYEANTPEKLARAVTDARLRAGGAWSTSVRCTGTGPSAPRERRPASPRAGTAAATPLDDRRFLPLASPRPPGPLFGFRKGRRGAPALRLPSAGVVLRTLFIGGSSPSSRRARRRAEARCAGRHIRARVQFTPHGPVAIHVVRARARRALRAAAGALERDDPRPRDGHLDAEAALAARDDGRHQRRLLRSDTGRPSGVLIRDGVVDSPPYGDRSSVGISPDGTLDVRRVEFFGTWRGLGQRRRSRPEPGAGAERLSLFTPSYGATTPAPAGVAAVVFPPSRRRRRTRPRGPVVEVPGGGGRRSRPTAPCSSRAAPRRSG